MLIHSPLQRAKETAEIVWNAREGPVKVLPSLREIDLYSFQVPAMGTVLLPGFCRPVKHLNGCLSRADGSLVLQPPVLHTWLNLADTAGCAVLLHLLRSCCTHAGHCGAGCMMRQG